MLLTSVLARASHGLLLELLHGRQIQGNNLELNTLSLPSNSPSLARSNEGHVMRAERFVDISGETVSSLPNHASSDVTGAVHRK